MTDLKKWLSDLGLEQYHERFRANDIEADILPYLTEDDLEKLGLSLGHRKRMLNAVQGSFSEQSAAAPVSKGETGESVEALADEVKRVTVLFADIQGSTPLTQDADPETAAQLLQSGLSRMADAIRRYEGTVNQYIGDGLMALFGAPIAHEDHALRACYAALAIQRGLNWGNAPGDDHGQCVVRVGVHTGDVIVRTIGNDVSTQYDASGPAVALASRLEGIAPAGGALISDHTARLVEGYLDLSPLGLQSLKGFEKPVDVFQITGARPAAGRLDAIASTRGLTTFVGRADELATLERAYKRVRRGDGQVVCAYGEPGVGKSRLIAEFAQSLRDKNCRVISGSSRSYGRTEAWEPVVGLLRAYFDVEDEERADVVRQRVSGHLRAMPHASGMMAAPILALLGLWADDPAWSGLSAPQRRRTTIDAVKQLLVHESGRQPLVVVLDDLHRMDDETLAFFNALFDGVPSNPILVLGASRLGYDFPWTTRGFYTQLRVDPVDATSGRAILDRLLGDDAGLADLKTQLLDDAGGNPFYLEESVFSLAEAGKLTGERGAYQLLGAADQSVLPDSVHALVSARIDRLPPGAKEVLQCASVIGSTIPFAVLRCVADIDEDALRDRLSVLQAREFIHETNLFPDVEYALKHPITREVAYDTLLRDRRKALHRRAGDALEALFSGTKHEIAETLARHFENSAAWAKAAEYYVLAAERDKERFLYKNATQLAAAAVRTANMSESCDADGLLACSLTTSGNIASLLGNLDEANAFYDRAIEAESASGNRASIEKRKHIPHVVACDDGRIAYYEHGRGSEITIVIVPALTYGLVPYQPLIERLCQDYRIITYDNLGTGRSDALPPNYSADSQVEHAVAVIEDSTADKVICVGASRAGNVALKLAAKRPDLVAAVAPICSSIDDHVTGTQCPLPPNVQAELDAAIADHDLERCMRVWANMILNDPGTQDLIEGFVQRAMATPEATWDFFGPNPELDLTPVLPKVKVPSLVMCGGRDLRVPLDVSRKIARSIPNAQLYVFRDQGHLPAWTAPDEFCQVLRSFVSGEDIGQSPDEV